MSRISIEELKKNNGKNGKKAWLSYSGTVYDVSESSFWKDGHHMNSHHAGHDLTEFLKNAPHGPEVFERVKEIGKLEEDVKGANTARGDVDVLPPGFIRFLLGQHPHPVSVHFPIALSITAVFFTFLGLLFSSESLKTAGFYNICMALLTTPFAVSAGFLSWYHNYKKAFTTLFTAKIILSATLFILLCAALITHIMGGDSAQSPYYWTYNLLVLFLAPNVAALGYLGGRITFPR